MGSKYDSFWTGQAGELRRLIRKAAAEGAAMADLASIRPLGDDFGVISSRESP
jgi:hypothetical protein